MSRRSLGPWQDLGHQKSNGTHAAQNSLGSMKGIIFGFDSQHERMLASDSLENFRELGDGNL
jgi:hypothetical protein